MKFNKTFTLTDLYLCMYVCAWREGASSDDATFSLEK